MPNTPKNAVQSIKRYLASVKEHDFALIEHTITKESIWSCTTCGACEEQCPLYIDHLDRTIGLRRNLVLVEDDYPREFAALYRNLEVNGNPWGIGLDGRAKWAENLGVKILSANESVDYLYWVGCAGSYDQRNQRVASAVVQLLTRSGINFGILGTEEKCCGDSARRTGNEYLFQNLARENIYHINSYNIKKVITSCPHCYNTLKNEYPQLGGRYEVLHHPELLAVLFGKGKLDLPRRNIKATYHDSCYLGRYNNIYMQPRMVLEAIPGLSLLEAKENKAKSFCCGAGGGRMWLEENIGTRINQKRIEQIVKNDVDYIATACPFCLTMLEDGIRTKTTGKQIKVKDISEIILEANSEMEGEPRDEDNSTCQADI